MKLTQYAVHRRLATSAIVVALVVLGLYGLFRLPVDFLPNVTYPMIKVHIWWRGATPDEIDRNIADPIERQMATVDDLDFLESSSIEGMYTLQANFKYGVNVDVAYQDALAAMARVARELPKDMDPPVVIKADPSQLPVVQMTVSSDQWDLVKLRTWVDEWLQDQLLAVPGVAGTEIVGGLKREIRVHLDPQALEKHGLTLPAVLNRLREENIEQFDGRVTVGPKEIIARTMGEYRSLDEIRDIVLARNGEAKLYLRDVADVQDASEEVRVITRLGGKPCVKLSVLKQANANTVAVAEAVSRRIQELGPALPQGIALGMVENQADYVGAALGGVRNAAIEAAVLLIFIVYMFLGSAFWLGLLTSISPCPLATNIAAISFLGRSVGNTRKVLLSGLLYTVGRTVVYVGLGVLILLVLQAASGGGGPNSAASGVSRLLQKYMGVILGPVLILVGMMLLGMLDFTGSLNLGGQGLQDRVAKGGAFWALPLGILFTLSFCPVSASLFFGGLIGLSWQHSSPVLLPMLFGVATAIPVIVFAFIITFTSQYVAKVFNRLTQIEKGIRLATGAVFILAGLYYTLTHIYGVSLAF